ncbi:MAG: hypothetical protein JO257_25505 [Deltaproteobacteria bacterium]|nr:hypothetical protein [Deltaproteobacteria bacterium]
MSPGTAYLAAYLPWRRIAHRERVALVERNAATVDPQLKHAIDFLRKGLVIEEKLAAEADKKLAGLGAPDGSPAAKAGEHARDAAVAAAVAADVAYLRCAAPNNPDLANQAHARAQQMKDAAARLTQVLAQTNAQNFSTAIADLIAARRDLEPTETAGYRQLNELAAKVADWGEAMAQHLDKAPAATSTKDAAIDADALLAGRASTRAKVRGAKGRIAEIVRSSALAKLEALDLDDQGVTDDDLIALAASPHVRHLRQLDLRYNPISARGIEALAASPHLKALEMVNLDGNPADPVDRLEYYDETNTHRVPTAAGKALEAKYGPLRWLHPAS